MQDAMSLVIYHDVIVKLMSCIISKQSSLNFDTCGVYCYLFLESFFFFIFQVKEL